MSRMSLTDLESKEAIFTEVDRVSYFQKNALLVARPTTFRVWISCCGRCQRFGFATWTLIPLCLHWDP